MVDYILGLLKLKLLNIEVTVRQDTGLLKLNIEVTVRQDTPKFLTAYYHMELRLQSKYFLSICFCSVLIEQVIDLRKARNANA